MHLDLQTIKIEPLRQTFDHLARRFGPKAATRYQEGTYDIQQRDVFHYKPTWEPGRMIFDERRTVIAMRDWYDLKDPRQFYYGTYTLARAKMQDAADATFQQAVDQGMAENLSVASRQLVSHFLVPARHIEWGANMNNCFVAAYGFGTAITAAAMYAAGDRLGMAQNISMIGLEVGGETSLTVAKSLWMEAPEWQPLRQYLESLFVKKDWFEVFVAQNLILDTLSFGLLYDEMPKCFSGQDTAFYFLASAFMREWHAESSRWVNAVMTTAIRESEQNKAILTEWTERHRAHAGGAMSALIQSIPNADAATIRNDVLSRLDDRLRGLGLRMTG